MNWDDIRFLLAIQRGRTLSAAARQLGVNQTTVARRLAALE
ncbi:MAG: LysR family transcriptional regulator, partial [Acidiferrobacterales bacterium]